MVVSDSSSEGLTELLHNYVSYKDNSLKVSLDKNLKEVFDLGISHFKMWLDDMSLFLQKDFKNIKCFLSENYF